jgi:hypothetical protein
VPELSCYKCKKKELYEYDYEYNAGESTQAIGPVFKCSACGWRIRVNSGE